MLQKSFQTNSLELSLSRHLVPLRVIMIVVLLLMAFAAAPWFHVIVPFAPVFTLSGVWLVVTAVERRYPLRSRLGDALVWIGIDVTMLTAILAVSGGPANPLTALYILPVAVAAAMLPARVSWLPALTAVAGYSTLWFAGIPLAVEDVERAADMHLIGMWVTFIASAILVAAFVTLVASALRDRERQLAAARERVLRDERVVALGSLAAGAAHALGTPLNTALLLADEIVAGACDAVHAGDAAELKRQIERCREILVSMQRDAGIGSVASATLSLNEWGKALLHDFRLRCPAIVPTLDVAGDIGSWIVVRDPAIDQALTALLDNAVDAGAQDIRVGVALEAGCLELSVRDNGSGFSGQALVLAGNEPYSEKADGLGLGLYLARAVVERVGGALRIANRNETGAVVTLVLPKVVVLGS